MRPAHTHGSAHRVDLVARPSQPARRQLIHQPQWRHLSQGTVRAVAVAGSARGAVPAFRRARFPEPPSEPGVPVIPAPGSPRGPLPTNGCVAARLRSTGLDCQVDRRYSPATPALPTRHRSPAVPLRHVHASRVLGLLRALRHDPPPTADDAPAHRPEGGEGGHGSLPTFTTTRSTSEVPSYTPAASPGVRRSPSPWPPHRPLHTGCGVARRYRDGRALLTGPDPPGWSRHVAYGASTLVPRVHLLVLLAGPGPSGSAGPSRRCQGCSHPPARLHGQAALSFAGLLRQAGGGALPSPPGRGSASWRR
jgi:hypothetical protein